MVPEHFHAFLQAAYTVPKASFFNKPLEHLKSNERLDPSVATTLSKPTQMLLAIWYQTLGAEGVLGDSHLFAHHVYFAFILHSLFIMIWDGMYTLIWNWRWRSLTIVARLDMSKMRTSDLMRRVDTSGRLSKVKLQEKSAGQWFY